MEIPVRITIKKKKKDSQFPKNLFPYVHGIERYNYAHPTPCEFNLLIFLKINILTL